MAERNPNIPHERRMEMEERTRIDEDEANRRFTEGQAAREEHEKEYARAQRAEQARQAGGEETGEGGPSPQEHSRPESAKGL